MGVRCTPDRIHLYVYQIRFRGAISVVTDTWQYWKGAVAVGDYGVWRAHLNVYQDMVQNRVQTALILEDDADWDVLLRHQMTDFAYGTRALQNATLPLRSPYGDNWDLLALGHIGVNNKVNKQQRYWVTPNDPTVIAESRRTWSRKPDVSTPKLAGDHTRIVLEVSKFTGAAAYALSLRGAATLLYDQSMLPNAQAIDVAMLALCRHDPYDTPFCLGAYPMIFGRYRAIGPVSKDSDRRTMSNDVEPGTGGFQSGQERKKPESEFTVFSTSLNIWRLMKGERVIPACVPDADLQKEVDLDHIAFPRGEVVEVEPEEYKDYQAALAEQRKKEDQAKEKQVEEEQKELKKDDDKKVRRWAA
jgi:GR25 family glycosyltransferase involved in LPS biosynthesis